MIGVMGYASDGKTCRCVDMGRSAQDSHEMGESADSLDDVACTTYIHTICIY